MYVVYLLDIFFCQIKSFIRFRSAFVFGLQTYYLISKNLSDANCLSIKGSGGQKQRLKEILETI